MLDDETENLYIQNIEEFVLDESRVVTYKWLSKTLGVHVNTAKQLLYAFATQSDEAKTAGIKKTFLVSGVLLNDGGCKVSVVQEEDLQKFKSHFKTVTSEHIYSVQKVNSNTTLPDLYKIDRFQKDDSNPVPAISCSKCLPRTDSEVAKLRLKAEAATITSDSKQWPTAPAKKLPPKSPSKKADVFNKQVTNGEAENTGNTVETNNAVTKNGAKAGSIAAMFAAQGSRVQKSAESAKVSTKPGAKGKGGGIATFFNRNVKEPNTHIEKTVKSQKEEIKSDLEEKKSQSSDCCSSLKEDCSSPEKKRKLTNETSEQESSPNKKRKIADDKKSSGENRKKKSSSTKSNNSKKGSKKKERGDDADGHPVKKRKRIIVADSDSDDDIFEKEEIPESPPPFEEPEPVLPSQQSELEDIIPCTPQQELNKGRKRIRKLVDKTFMDEDGYMITKKEFVYESCSESDGEEGKENEAKATTDTESKNHVTKESERKIKESPKKKPSPPQKSKQATLTNFFKKS